MRQFCVHAARLNARLFIGGDDQLVRFQCTDTRRWKAFNRNTRRNSTNSFEQLLGT